MRHSRLIVGVVCLLSLMVDGGYATLHYLTYHAPAFDLAFFDNVTEHPWHTTFLHYSFLGQHWEPVLLLGSALDHITPTPLWLILIQAIGLASAPLGAALLARSWLPQWGSAPAIAAVITALNPLLCRAAAADFHTEALTPALTLFALAAAARGRTGWLLLCCALLMITKEDAVLAVVGIGRIVWRIERRPLLGGALVVAGVAVLVSRVPAPTIRGADTRGANGEHFVGQRAP